MDRLSAELLRREQDTTLGTPRMPYGPLARALVLGMDLVYGRYASLADVFRQIGYDERVHKEESLRRVAEPRFS